jgi:hypothetical protein
MSGNAFDWRDNVAIHPAAYAIGGSNSPGQETKPEPILKIRLSFEHA